MEGDSVFITVDSTQACPPLGRETLFCKTVLFIIILEKMRMKVIGPSLHKTGRNMRTLPSPTRGLSHNTAYFNKQLTFKSHIVLARSSLSRLRLRVNEFWVRNREQLSVSIGFPYLKSLPTWEGK